MKRYPIHQDITLSPYPLSGAHCLSCSFNAYFSPRHRFRKTPTPKLIIPHHYRLRRYRSHQFTLFTLAFLIIPSLQTRFSCTGSPYLPLVGKGDFSFISVASKPWYNWLRQDKVCHFYDFQRQIYKRQDLRVSQISLYSSRNGGGVGCVWKGMVYPAVMRWAGKPRNSECSRSRPCSYNNGKVAQVGRVWG